MNVKMPLNESIEGTDFSEYEKQFKALADEKRLHLLAILCKEGSACVCDLTDILNIPQSKLSYHIKILLDVGMIIREKKGTWNYYKLNNEKINHLLSEELCCLFRPAE